MYRLPCTPHAEDISRSLPHQLIFLFFAITDAHNWRSLLPLPTHQSSTSHSPLTLYRSVPSRSKHYPTTSWFVSLRPVHPHRYNLEAMHSNRICHTNTLYIITARYCGITVSQLSDLHAGCYTGISELTLITPVRSKCRPQWHTISV